MATKKEVNQVDKTIGGVIKRIIVGMRRMQRMLLLKHFRDTEDLQALHQGMQAMYLVDPTKAACKSHLFSTGDAIRSTAGRGSYRVTAYGWCSRCAKHHDLSKNEHMDCVPPLHIVRFGPYRLSREYREALNEYCSAYTTEEIVGSYLGYNPHFPTEESR